MGEIADYDADRLYDLDDDPMDRHEEFVTIDYELVITETNLAWYLMLDNSDPFNPVKEWFPKSQCDLDEDTILVPQWLAEKKGLV